ncbi:MAG: homoserine dehydrogenase [Glycocaulis sp.]
MTGLAALSPASHAALRPVPAGRPMRAVLIGHGVVGGGVAERLPAGIDLQAIVVRTRRDACPRGVPVFTNPEDALSLNPELVIEALPGGAFAESVIERAVAAGAHVVSANKEVLARRGDLAAAARAKGRALLCSAAVGGGVPVLETIASVRTRGREITGIKGVLNGTSNFVLDRLAAGQSLESAVSAAQEAGFAEADPSADLDGDDAAAKLCLIARAAWGVELDPGSVARQSIRDLAPGLAAKAAREGRRVRQLARLARAGGGVHAAVRLDLVDADSVFYRTRDEGNAVVIQLQDAPGIVLTGKGAGRVPTAASMIGDIRRLLAERR